MAAIFYFKQRIVGAKSSIEDYLPGQNLGLSEKERLNIYEEN